MYSGKKAQHDFPKMRGGGSKAVWNFSKNSSLLEMPSFPNHYDEDYEDFLAKGAKLDKVNIADSA